ncbi:hypothetical protein B7P43_G09526 [Cryptotermes secundus]|uniref:Cytochrome P450 305a1 n=3 Tax=Cryptotermes secundus TaxID=105785 RepID=A0A2J7QMM9_9NEOP|nr:hypothetical protein B7P43_G09526 [Cryptotermes secundus]
MHEAVAALAREHDTPVLGLKLGADLTIVVFGHELVKQVFVREEFDGRPDTFFIRLRAMGGRRGITFTDGKFWHEQRSFAVRHLRQVGFGKELMEDMIMDELQELVRLFGESSQAGRSVSMGPTFAPSVLNVLWVLTTGASFSSRDDPRLHRLLHVLKARAKAFDMAGGTLNQFPWMRFLAPERTGHNLILRLNSDLKDIFMASILEHQKGYSPDKTNDLIDAFLHEMETRKAVETSSFTVDQLIMICMDFFIAGAQTTSTTLDFVFIMMLLYPDVQRRVQAELDAVVGRGRPPQLADRNKLPYVEAVLTEVQRMYQVTPVAGPRRVTKDTTLHGYNIPKDTTVLMSLWSVHYDRQHWKDPEQFRPERHLNDKGELVVDEWLLPFGLGRRRCLGEALARSCLFIFFAGVLQNFDVLPVPSKELPGEAPVPGLTLSPQPYSVMLKPRLTHMT